MLDPLGPLMANIQEPRGETRWCCLNEHKNPRVGSELRQRHPRYVGVDVVENEATVNPLGLYCGFDEVPLTGIQLRWQCEDREFTGMGAEEGRERRG